jgi:hypothetical protein
VTSHAANEDTQGTRIVLVVNDEPLGDEVLDQIAERAGDGELHVHLVAPAVAETVFQHLAGGVDESIAKAKERLERLTPVLEDRGIVIDEAQVGDADPVNAAEAVLLEQPSAFEEVIFVARAGDDRRPLEKEQFERAEERLGIVVTNFEMAGSGRIAEEQHADAGERNTAGEVPTRSGNLPSLTRTDVIGMVIGFAGTALLWIFAVNCVPDEASRTENAIDGCELTLLLAIGFFLINVAHAVGLMLFQSTRYRGVFEKFFARVSLYGTSIAAVVGAIIH